MTDDTARPRRRRGQLALLATSVALVAPALVALTPTTATAATPNETAAAILRSFDPSNIIGDGVMFNPGTMTAPQIQSFLDAQVPTCRPGYTCLKDFQQTTTTRAADPMCAQYTGAANETAATIIAKVGVACGVNPQVLLVILQKEEGLITDDWPESWQYRSATGYGCPDSSVCDSQYYGFYNQVYKAAWAMKRYTTPPGTTGPGWTNFNWIPVGTPTGILYNPNPYCGSQVLTIKNKATASLYYYTPYAPNTAALAAGFGTGDSCSAYGNRNFFLYFTEWFGSTHYTVSGAINTLWTSLGGATGSLGEPAGAATAAGSGSSQTFSNGAIFSSSAGTFAVPNTMLSRYQALGGPAGFLGWPRMNAFSRSYNGGGSIQGFQGGVLYSSPAGTYAVSGLLHTAYDAYGSAGGRLGWPTSDVTTISANGGGSSQSFTAGTIYASKATGSRLVLSTMDRTYRALGGPAGSIGWPRMDAFTRSYNGGGSIQGFQGAALYSSPAGGTHAVSGALHSAYDAKGAAGGSLGWPTGDATTTTANGGGSTQVFSNGTISISRTGSYVVPAPMAIAYQALGGPTGFIGWPRMNAFARTYNGGGLIQGFQGAALYSSPSGGSHAVSGAIHTAYDTTGAAAGSLGWPTGDATGTAGGGSQSFSNGTIYSSRGGTFVVTSAMDAKYRALGGSAGFLAWPRMNAFTRSYNGGGSIQGFQGGALYSSPAGVYAVSGPLHTAYGAIGAAAGRLGWPTGDPTTANGVLSQRFTGGTISWTSSGGAVVK